MVTTLSIASRSLSRELASGARPDRPNGILHPWMARPIVEQATALIAEAVG
jgi:hypothetical protein